MSAPCPTLPNLEQVSCEGKKESSGPVAPEVGKKRNLDAEIVTHDSDEDKGSHCSKSNKCCMKKVAASSSCSIRNKKCKGKSPAFLRRVVIEESNTEASGEEDNNEDHEDDEEDDSEYDEEEEEEETECDEDEEDDDEDEAEEEEDDEEDEYPDEENFEGDPNQLVYPDEFIGHVDPHVMFLSENQPRARVNRALAAPASATSENNSYHCRQHRCPFAWLSGLVDGIDWRLILHALIGGLIGLMAGMMTVKLFLMFF